MKRKFFPSVGLVIFLILSYALLAIFYPNITVWLGVLILLPALGVLVILLSPLGARKLGDLSDYSLSGWWLRILASQSLLLILEIQFFLAMFHASPAYLDGSNALIILEAQAPQYQLWPWPGFPFIPAIVWGLSLSFFTYCKGRLPFHHNHADLLYRGKYAIFSKAYTEMLVQISTQIALTVSLVGAIVGAVLGLHWLKDWPLYSAFPVGISFILLLFFPVVISKKAKSLERRLAREKWGLGFYVLIMAFCLVWVLIFLAGIFDNLIERFPFAKMLTGGGGWLRYLAETPEHGRLMMFYWGAWLIWTPLLSSYYAAISKGRQIRTYIIGTAIFPILMQCLFLYMNISLIHEASNTFKGTLMLILSLLVSLILLFIMRGKKDTRFMVTGFMPENKKVAVGRTSLSQASKVYGLSHYLGSFFLGIVAIIMLQTMGGWYFIGLIMGVFAPCLIYKTVVITTSLFVQMLKDRQRKK